MNFNTKVAALAIVFLWGSAHAQFVDERTKAAPAKSAVPVPSATLPVSAAPVVAPEAEKKPAQKWQMKFTDVRMAETFIRWGRVAGYQVRWDAPKHVLVEGEDTFEGTFQSVLESVLSTPGIRNSTQPLEVCFYPNTPPLARITLMGEQSKECR